MDWLKKSNKLECISYFLSIINGIICIVYGEKILSLLPTICGGILLIKGIMKLIEGIIDKDYANLEQMKMEKSFISIAIGIGVLLKQNDALFIVGMFWGVHGLIKSANYLNIALYNFCNKEKWKSLFIKFIVEFSLSSALIFDPFGKLGHHITILGLELIFDGFTDLINQSKKLKQDDKNSVKTADNIGI